MTHNFRKIAAAGLVAGTALGLTACAPVDEPAADEYDATLASLDTERACFFVREVNGYSTAPGGSSGNERIWVDTGVRERFLLETRGVCPDLDFSHQIGIDAGGSISICSGQTEFLLVPSTIRGEVDRCPVRVLGRERQE